MRKCLRQKKNIMKKENLKEKKNPWEKERVRKKENIRKKDGTRTLDYTYLSWRGEVQVAGGDGFWRVLQVFKMDSARPWAY